MAIKLGQTVTDRITGFTGMVVGITLWLHGCNRCGVQSAELKDGKPIDHQWFDEQQLTTKPKAKIGGPKPTAPSRDPIR